MTPAVDVKSLARVKWWEYALRFAFGGLVTAATGLVAKWFGATIAGLFLAFPAILPASLTLVKQHDGRAAAIADARGGRIGVFGLAAFALVVVATALQWPAAIVLAGAMLVWLGVSLLGWQLVDGRRR